MLIYKLSELRQGPITVWYDCGCIQGYLDIDLEHLEQGLIHHNDNYFQGQPSTRPGFKYCIKLDLDSNNELVFNAYFALEQ